MHPEKLLLEVEVGEVVGLADVGRTAVIAVRDEAAFFDPRPEFFEVGAGRAGALRHDHFIDAAHDARLSLVFFQKIDRVAAAVDFKGKEGVDAALEKEGDYGAQVAVAIGEADVDAGFPQFGGDALVAGTTTCSKKSRLTSGPRL